MGSEGLHEAPEALQPSTVDRHRAVRSIMEELDAIDWYDQRVDATGDASLAEVLAHNRDEEKEHASMAIEWLRRHDAVFDRHLRTYLFSEGSIVGEEQEAEHGVGVVRDRARGEAVPRQLPGREEARRLHRAPRMGGVSDHAGHHRAPGRGPVRRRGWRTAERAAARG